jgi:hypothetical protein
MSDSSSVDRWHPSNVLAQSLARIDSLWRFHKEEFEWADKDENLEVLSAAIQEIEACHKDYANLYADRGRVLAAARELAEAVGSDLMYVEGATVSDRTLAALASFREVDQ